MAKNHHDPRGGGNRGARGELLIFPSFGKVGDEPFEILQRWLPCSRVKLEAVKFCAFVVFGKRATRPLLTVSHLNPVQKC